MTFITRFAPSPTGPLHLGHAYSALLAHDMARACGGCFLLRIEDIDRTRSKPEWERQIYDDLTWLGLRWDAPPMRQSDRLGAYDAALESLWVRGLVYPCTCTRRDIAEAASAPQEGGDPVSGPDGVVYPGTCRNRPRPTKRPTDTALRLDMAAALNSLESEQNPPLCFTETGSGPQGETGEILITPDDLLHLVGDVVLARRDMGTSYHLSVVVDDAAQNISHVIRGADLFKATQIHVVLQRLLGLASPEYHHHRLIRDEAGKRLAKRDDARALAKYRAEGCTPDDIRAMVGMEPTPASSLQ
ncbi:tRNA glutamyl-Q(34) synthetase GluQRS [Puniceibacterium sediminis]|uniref:Glutamyl-Q tRNA(Asp) synthetase n=1 Tax=Puniceibacterium sediminis TaxID=1608407 RepID=A0A238YID3_9RHOB|nr:tRNA glutamyl-Q(34) synthetase GluQRS [Puniceibacterium sediminis]SNR70558.1 glutamyl-Q tRNA(Asp) synthetase [Puniceibacterium sediminis]